ncbi:winged helix-turn-helix domain-containing protein [Yinghuangia aomiensis]|uniref:Winged helix-turn-helix domain-containing protein n=1 Tax=Yinghuangia aomiensis TaxID=676205 RepID=A0ABP9IB22_9ACTN
MSPPPPERAASGNGDRSAIYRTLANPLRRRILGHLQRHGEANSTGLAKALDESTGTTSYHLRKLAEQGFVEEITERSTGRERWWRPLPFDIRMPDPEKMAAAELSAAMAFTRRRADQDVDLYFRVLTQYEGPGGWAQLMRGNFHMTKDELLAFVEEYSALLWKYGHTPQDAPEGARRVALRLFAVPDAGTDEREGDEGDEGDEGGHGAPAPGPAGTPRSPAR